MTKLSLLLALTFFLFATAARVFTSEAHTLMSSRFSERPSRVYLGPEFLSFQVDTHVKDVQVSGYRFFCGFRFGYEYLTPHAFYGAAELLATNAVHDFSISNEDLLYRGKGGAGFGSIQTRFGYTLPTTNCLMTPYVGLGIYALSKYVHNGFEESLGYVSGGLRTQLACSSVCLIALNMEVFRTLGVQQTIKLGSVKTTHRMNDWGCNIGVPLTMRLSQGWDMQLTPYYLRLLFSQAQNIYGSTLLFSYRF